MTATSDTRSITVTDLAARLDDRDLTIVDVRPLAAYNGWRLGGEARGGHIPGAVAFPTAWLGSVDEPEIERLLRCQGHRARSDGRRVRRRRHGSGRARPDGRRAPASRTSASSTAASPAWAADRERCRSIGCRTTT